VRLWDVRTGKLLGNPLRHGGIVKAAVFSPDGKTILSGSSDHTARLWDLDTGMPLGQPLQHSTEVSNVDLSSNGRVALTICPDGSAYLWDVPSCEQLARPLQHEVAVNDGRFSADGSMILFTCADGQARLYDVPLPLSNDRKMIRAWARAVSDFQLDDKGLLRQLSQAEWLAAQQELQRLNDQ
jgi:WD40 repeat protein